jgi:hypothetical protein
LPAIHDDQALFGALTRAAVTLPGVTIVPLDARAAVETARVRASTVLKLADAAIIAAARIANCCGIVGNDGRWRGRPLGLPYHHLDDLLAMNPVPLEP